MVENIRKSLRESKTARWTALAIVAFTMLCGYYLTDVMAPLKGLLENQLGWNSNEYGFFTSAYGWFNVFLFMLIIGGIILDKMGIRFTGLMATSIMVIGAGLKYYAISTNTLEGITWHILWFDAKAQVMLAALGYAIFGVGVEVAGITVSKTIVKWFKGKEMALAMGLEMATARIGTALALATSVPIAESLGHVSKPILMALLMLCIGLIGFIVYVFMDVKLDKENADFNKENNIVNDEEAFRISDIFKIITNKGWWYIALLCVLFYSAVFPFLKYATDLMVQKFNVPQDLAGLIPAMLPFGTILLTPFFGNLYDRKGKGATIMIIGSFLLIFVHSMFAIPFINHWLIAIVLIIILGIGFSLVPSAMWPSVPKIIPENQLGSAYSLIFWVQNWGLMGVPALIGWVLDAYCVVGYRAMPDGKTAAIYDYTLPMIIFTSFSLLALLFAFLLKAEDKKKGYGLELPNIKK
ncbi:MAG: MFS transporter [Bacteroidales bacterium]|nr:MFS transporter [Bacteroidales bacterium]